DAWFRPIQFDGFDEQDKVLHLRASQVNKDWVSTYYSEVITQTLKELNLTNYSLDWSVEESEVGKNGFTDDDDETDFFPFEKQNSITNAQPANHINYLERPKVEI